jgi:hypothetical protein
MQIVIEKNVPVPPSGSKTKPLSDFTKTIMSMEVGDSYVVPDLPRYKNRHTYVAKVKGCGFKTRKTDHGVRVWRVA